MIDTTILTGFSGTRQLAGRLSRVHDTLGGAIPPPRTGRRTVARGEAKQNPWFRAHPTITAPQGPEGLRRLPPPLPGRNGLVGSGFHGFRRQRRLHPWLHSVAPSGAKIYPPKLSRTRWQQSTF